MCIAYKCLLNLFVYIIVYLTISKLFNLLTFLKIHYTLDTNFVHYVLLVNAYKTYLFITLFILQYQNHSIFYFFKNALHWPLISFIVIACKYILILFVYNIVYLTVSNSFNLLILSTTHYTLDINLVHCVLLVNVY